MLLNCGVEEDSWESLGLKDIQPVHAKGNQSWIFIGRLMLKLKLLLWPPVAKSWLIWKDPDAEKDWGQEEKGTTEDEMAGWHHQLNGHECGWTPGVGDGQGGLACCGSWVRKESDMTEWLNWTEMPLGPLGPLSVRLNKHGLIFSGLEGTESSCTAGETAHPGTGN